VCGKRGREKKDQIKGGREKADQINRTGQERRGRVGRNMLI